MLEFNSASELVSELANFAAAAQAADGSPGSPGSKEIQFTATPELLAKIERLKALISRETGASSYAAVFERLTDLALKRLESSSTPAEAVIPAKTRALVWQRDAGRCTYANPTTGRRCVSTYALRVDYRVPAALGGSLELTNLRLLCPTHQAVEARQALVP